MAATNLAQIAQKLLEDSFKQIVHDIVIHRHHDHKLMLASLNPETKLPHCEKCNLPRLLDPPLAPKVRGATSDPPRDTQYCDKRPWCRIPGFDIYGNPFPKSDVTGRPPTKKEREAAKNGSKKDNDGTPASNEGGEVNGTAPPSPSQDGDEKGSGKPEKLEKGEKKASKIDEKLKKGEYVPWQTCPSCKRSLLITRFAKHLEQCMGLSGRAASRNAMAKMNGSTPSGSRGGTPGPSQESKEKDFEDEEGTEKLKGPGGVRKKMLKKGMKEKMKKDKTIKDGTTNGKAPKGSASKPRGSPAPSSAAGDGKRDRDEMLMGDDGEEDEAVHVKKRQKLQRVMSTASNGSQSTAPPGNSLELERVESNDGSFIDDADAGSAGED